MASADINYKIALFLLYQYTYHIDDLVNTNNVYPRQSFYAEELLNTLSYEARHFKNVLNGVKNGHF